MILRPELRKAFEFCEMRGLRGIVLAVPFQLAPDEEVALRDHPLCRGMVLTCPSPHLTADSSAHWLGCFEERGHWRLPRCSGPVVLVGSQMLLSRSMVSTLVRSRRLSIICVLGGRYGVLPLPRFLAWRFGEAFVQWVNTREESSLTRRLLYALARNRLLLIVWTRLFKREGLRAVARSSGLSGEDLYREILRRAESGASLQAVPGRVLLVNNGLAAGGAERQIVNTLIGLQDSGACESVAFLAEYMDRTPELAFFLLPLQEAGIEVLQVRKHHSVANDGLSHLPVQLADILGELPPALLEEVLNLSEEYCLRRPEVVHAWQDSTSIKAGIAAAIAGVPRVILGGRNVSPPNFCYVQDYMRPAYRALAGLQRVLMVNNSEAGRDDYARWLGLPRERIAVLRNGIDLTGLRPADDADRRAYRAALGIPASAPLVGSVFRFYEEKQPVLWIEVARRVAQSMPDVHFLIVGEGPMRGEMAAAARGGPLEGKLHMPGKRPDVALPLSVMDVFLLTSLFEGTPNVVLEAQWMGLPVVASDAGGTREAVHEGVTGWIANDPEALAERVRALLSEPSLRQTAGRNGRAFVSTRYGVPRMIEETLKVYGLGAAAEIEPESHAPTCAPEGL